MSRGFADDGRQLAQVAHVLGPGGEDRGWMVWLLHRPRELFDRYPTKELAMDAAENALDSG